MRSLLMLQAQNYMSDQVRKQADSINATRSIQETLLQQNAAVAGEIITADNATAETIEKKAKSRFKLVEILKNLLVATDESLAWLNSATRDVVAEYDRLYLKAIPEATAKITKDLVSIGFTEDVATKHAFCHPILFRLRSEIHDVQSMQHGVFSDWRKLLNEEKASLGFELQDAVRHIS